MIDIYLQEEEGTERVLVEANSPRGEEFVDAWIGAILSVIDSGRIIIPREVAAEFVTAARRSNLRING